MGFGLSEEDVDVYIFLAKRGPKIERELSKALNKNKQQVYRSLKELRQKQLVFTTIESSARFQAVPFEKVLDLFVRSKIKEAKQLLHNKKEILSP